MVTRPKTKKSMAARNRNSRTGTRSAKRDPAKTAMLSATSIPRVVPMVTCTVDANRAPRATVASCVLSPISARKNTTVVVTRGPQRRWSVGASTRSGTSVQIPKAMKLRPRTQETVSGSKRAAPQAPTVDASAWLKSVARRIPSITSHGRPYLIPRVSAMSCVLSPISATATTVKELNSAVIALHSPGRAGFGELPLGAVLATAGRQRFGTSVVASALLKTPQPETAQPERIEGPHAEDPRVVRDRLIDKGVDVDERVEDADGLLEAALHHQPATMEPGQLVIARISGEAFLEEIRSQLAAIELVS